MIMQALQCTVDINESSAVIELDIIQFTNIGIQII